MTTAPIVNPQIPYVDQIPGGLHPGKLLRIQGVTHPNSDRFNINLATGPNSKPRDDTGLHISVRLNQGYIARNSYENGGYGSEEDSGNLPIGHGQSFEILILIEPNQYKIAVNGQHFCEFNHRIPVENISHLLIDGDVSITLISFEGVVNAGDFSATAASQLNAAAPQYAPPGGNYGPPPPGNYGPPPQNYGYAPPPPPGAEPQSEFGGFLDQAQDILAGAIKSGAAEKLLGSILSSGGGGNQQQHQATGYAPQNAQYGIYPSLPQSNDPALNDLILQSGGTITSGGGSGGANPASAAGPLPGAPRTNSQGQGQHQPGLFKGLLLNFLDSNGANRQNTTADGTQQNQPDILSNLLSNYLNPGNNQPQQQQQQQQANVAGNLPQPGQGTTSEMITGLLQSLLNSNNTNQQQQPQSSISTPSNNQTQNTDTLSGILSSLISPSPNVNQSNGSAATTSQNPSQTNPDQNQLSNLLQSLLVSSSSSNNQQSASAEAGAGAGTNPTTQNNQSINQTELLNLLRGVLSKAVDQHNATRPIQENPNYPAGGLCNGGQIGPQYGQYPQGPPPMAQQQQQQGPVESLLSGLLGGGGGGNTQQQQPHGPQVGGDGSGIGGLGSVGGLLGSLAGQLLHKPN